MRKIMAPLVILNMMLAMAFLGFAIMVSYSGNFKADARRGSLQKQVTELKARKDKLEKAANNAPLREQGVEFLEQEVGKSGNLLKDIEPKRLSVAREELNKNLADLRRNLTESSEKNDKAASQELAEKLRNEKELRQKVEQFKKEVAAARQLNEEREAKKVELTNQQTQQGQLLEVARGRAEQVSAMVKQFDAAGAAP